jgi:hypothetical protein
MQLGASWEASVNSTCPSVADVWLDLFIIVGIIIFWKLEPPVF